MTPQQALTIIEAAVKEACPEIMELSMGCKVKLKTSGRIFQYIRKWGEGIHECSYLNIPDEDQVPQSYSQQNFDIWFEILGHDITLEHVLKAMHSIYIVEARTGRFMQEGPYGNSSEDYPCWLLGKPLHEQSDPCKLFLAEIFGK